LTLKTSPTHRDIYQALCKVLTDRADQVDWSAYQAQEWLYFTQRATAEGIAPLIYWKFKHKPEVFQTLAPASIYSLLQAEYYRNLARNQVLFAELERILRGLQEAGIPVIGLKGAVLATTLYEDIGLRPMSDLDLLVQPEQVEAAVELIRAMGYERQELSNNDALEKELAHHVHLTQVGKPNLEVEVHWRLASGEASLFQPRMEWFWQNTLTWQSKSNHGYILSSTAHLLFLCAHLALQHGIGMGALIWFMDIYKLIERDGTKIDWIEFSRQAKAFGWSAAAYYTLKETHERLEADIPEGLLFELQSQMRPQEENLVRAKSISGQNIAYFALTDLGGLRLATRIRSVVVHLFPNPNFMRQRYRVGSYWALPLYYPYRWWDMTRKLIEMVRLKRAAKTPP